MSNRESTIETSNIDKAFPVAAQDNDSQGFRNNFTNIVSALDVAKAEITELQHITIPPLEPPLTPLGLIGDVAGMIISDPANIDPLVIRYVYFCHTSYSTGSVVIWDRVAIVPPASISAWE